METSTVHSSDNQKWGYDSVYSHGGEETYRQSQKNRNSKNYMSQTPHLASQPASRYQFPRRQQKIVIDGRAAKHKKSRDRWAISPPIPILRSPVQPADPASSSIPRPLNTHAPTVSLFRSLVFFFCEPVCVCVCFVHRVFPFSGWLLFFRLTRVGRFGLGSW